MTSPFDQDGINNDEGEEDMVGLINPAKKDKNGSIHGLKRSRYFYMVCLAIVLGLVVAIQTGRGMKTYPSLSSPSSNNATFTKPTSFPFTYDYHDMNRANISRICLLGERTSGTNYIENVLKKAFFPNYSGNHPEYPYGKDIPIFTHKHMFRNHLLGPEEMQTLRQQHSNDKLWILVVRSPCEWADALKRNPWHLCTPNRTCAGGFYISTNKEAVANMTRAQFFRMPWTDWMESNIPCLENTTIYQQDKLHLFSRPQWKQYFQSHPEGCGEYTYDNVFQLRSHKLRLMLQVIQAVSPERVYLAHLKSVETNPQGFINNLVKRFHLTANSVRLTPSPKKHGDLCLLESEWDVARNEIDWELEGHLGFNYMDCHVCP